MNEIIRVLVDSTYILPAFGIKVIGLGDENLLKLERLRIRRLVGFFLYRHHMGGDNTKGGKGV